MLSYLHAYHAGNHADVLKHTVLLALLDALTAKPKPLRYVETHAGAGSYDLRSSEASRNREFASGIGKLWSAADAPPPVARLLELAREHNGPGALIRYPGSPWLARRALRNADRLHLFELHPREHRALAASCEGDSRCRVERRNGLEACVGLVPPPERRGLVLIDPSYERGDEQAAVLDALAKLQRRFATGVYAVWYPVVERRWVTRFERAVRAMELPSAVQLELAVAPDARGRGLTGSGMLVVNPPWRVTGTIQAALPWLARTLGADGGGTYRVATLASG